MRLVNAPFDLLVVNQPGELHLFQYYLTIIIAITFIITMAKATTTKAGWALVDRWDDTLLTGKLLTPRFAPAALSSEDKRQLAKTAW